MKMLIPFDVETNIVKLPNGDFTSSPFNKDTRIVVMSAAPTWEAKTLCGHNIAFDMLHALKDSKQTHWAQGVLFNGVWLWDTMIVDYLCYAGKYRSPSLEETCRRWKVPFKKDQLIQEYFEAGRGADVLIEDGHEQRLRVYHAEDERATLEVARAQLARLKGTRMFNVVKVQLRALSLVILEQWSGLPVDLVALAEACKTTDHRLKESKDAILKLLELSCFNPASNPHVATALYGGVIVEKTRIEKGVFKTGKHKGEMKYRPNMVEHALSTHLTGNRESVDEAHLNKIKVETDDPWVKVFCEGVLVFRELAKLNGTYLQPMVVNIEQSFDGRLHGDINMAVANTGRKSSSNPNLQNIPDPVRTVIAARPGWRIVTADFKQLEVVAWAYQSQDPALYADILAGVDIHERTLKTIEKETGQAPNRTDVKRINFGRIYGGGPRTLSAQSGVAYSAVTTIINTLDSLYPIGKGFGDTVMEALKRRSKPLRDDSSPLPHRQSWYELPSGRALWYRTYENASEFHRRKSPTDFGYSQCKNRPIQSFATADIVPLAEALLMERLGPIGINLFSWLRPLVSVHDEMVFECKEERVGELRNLLRQVESNLVPELNKRFKLARPFDLPLVLKVGVGANWSEAKG